MKTLERIRRLAEQQPNAPFAKDVLQFLAAAVALEHVLDEFDYWVSDPMPAIDGGTVRIHKFREVQPAMERRITEARATLEKVGS